MVRASHILMRWSLCLFCTRKTSGVWILTRLNNSPQINLWFSTQTHYQTCGSPLRHIITFRAYQSLFFHLYDACYSEEAININLIVFRFTRTRTGIEYMIHRCRGKHANHYNTDPVVEYVKWKIVFLENATCNTKKNVHTSVPWKMYILVFLEKCTY